MVSLELLVDGVLVLIDELDVDQVLEAFRELSKLQNDLTHRQSELEEMED